MPEETDGPTAIAGEMPDIKEDMKEAEPIKTEVNAIPEEGGVEVQKERIEAGEETAENETEQNSATDTSTPEPVPEMEVKLTSFDNEILKSEPSTTFETKPPLPRLDEYVLRHLATHFNKVHCGRCGCGWCEAEEGGDNGEKNDREIELTWGHNIVIVLN